MTAVAQQKIPDISLCGAVHLLAAISGHDIVALEDKYGLALRCARCDKAYERNNKKPYARKGYCSGECLRASRYVLIACSQCGKLVKRSIKGYLGRNQRGYKSCSHYKGRVFCDRHCWNVWQGNHYGWGLGVSLDEKIQRLRQRLAELEALKDALQS